MEHLTKLFKLAELTRSQIQNGYALSGIPKDQISTLAEHQYLVTFMAWQLARNANYAGANLNVEKVMEQALTHDLGELFGGDIATPYALVNPRAKKFAKAFEAENHKFFSKFFGPDKNHFKKLSAEIMNAKTDEALVAKLADYVECTHFKLYTTKRFGKRDLAIARLKCYGYVKKMKDKVAKQALTKFVDGWIKELPKATPWISLTP